MFIDNENIPVQKMGHQTDIIEHICLQDERDAEELYNVAKLRLLNMWNWSNIADGPSSEFELTDKYGDPVNRPAQRGDKLKINLPGSKFLAGNHSDWVVVMSIIEEFDPFENTALTAIKVRPTTDPKSNKKEIAHFFDPHASITFLVRRIGHVVSAEIHGRNEVTNAKAESLLEVARHYLLAIRAKLGLSKSEWAHLSKGFLGTLKANRANGVFNGHSNSIIKAA